jgi:FMN phosphatase YigB (HAD superfamily)
VPTIKALIFDLWGTLAVDTPEVSQARNRIRLRLLGEALAAAGHARSEEEIAAAVEAFAKSQAELQAREKDISSPERAVSFLERLDPSLPKRLSPEALHSVDEAIAGAGRYAMPIMADGALETLADGRRRGLGLGLISNIGYTTGYVMREVFARWGLAPYLDVLTFSDEAGEAKPAPGIFRRTLRALDVEAEEAAFVGDMPALDVLGALAVGMWSVQIGDHRLDGAEPHARISRLSDVFPALESLGLVPRRGAREPDPTAGDDA